MCAGNVPNEHAKTTSSKVALFTIVSRLRKDLFMSQSDHRIDAHGAAGGNVTGEQGDPDKKQGYTRKRHRICRVDAKKKTRHRPRHNNCANQAECRSPNREPQAL